MYSFIANIFFITYFYKNIRILIVIIMALIFVSSTFFLRKKVARFDKINCDWNV